MIGGKVISVEIQEEDKTVLIEVQDDPPYQRDKSKRLLPLTEKTRCIGTGDSIWWQNKIHYWTPQASERKDSGRDCDIRVTGSGS